MQSSFMMNSRQGVSSIGISAFQITDTVSYESKRSADVSALKRVLKLYLYRFGFPECLNHIKCYNNFVNVNNVNYNGFDKKQIAKMIETLQIDIASETNKRETNMKNLVTK